VSRILRLVRAPITGVGVGSPTPVVANTLGRGAAGKVVGGASSAHGVGREVALHATRETDALDGARPGLVRTPRAEVG